MVLGRSGGSRYPKESVKVKETKRLQFGKLSIKMNVEPRDSGKEGDSLFIAITIENRQA
jgi:hypothetical protein